MRTVRLIAYGGLLLATVAVVFLAGFGTHALLAPPSPESARAPLAATGPAPESSPRTESDAENGFGVFWQAWHILQQEFYGDQPGTQQRTYGAIKGLTEAYQDPYTYFVEPQPRQREKEQLSGEFGGIGAYITVDDSGRVRLDPMPARPAERAGIQEDDILQAVDGAPIPPEASAEDVVALVRGPIGEAVTLTLLRESSGETLTVNVVRERIETPTVEWRLLEQDVRTGYIAISLFSERTAAELDRALSELEAGGATRLILDLRHNSGGLLQASIDVSSRFLSDGVVLFERKNDGSETPYRVVDVRRAPGWPMTVLVDGATASAAEIVAGALQDRERATLIGDKTFGKGSVQLVHDLEDGSSIHVTVARWLTPNGHEINGVGLTPDREVPHEDGRDAPLESAISFLNEDTG